MLESHRLAEDGAARSAAANLHRQPPRRMAIAALGRQLGELL
jgi:hypothetical protein